MERTVAGIGLLILRLMMGAGIVRHGYGKVVEGHASDMVGAIGKMGFPVPLLFAWAAGLSEFLGGILIVLGLATRVGALFVGITMAVAAFMFHAHDALGVKELALGYLAMALTLLGTGAGPYSLDRLLGRK